MLFKKKIIALLVFLVSFCALSAQGNRLLTSVVVYEGTEIPVADVTLEFKELSLVATTDENGVFSFKKELPAGKHVISVAKEGFIPKEKLVEKIEGEKIDLLEIEIALTKKEKKRREKEKKEEEIAEASGAKDELKKIKEFKKEQKRLAKVAAKEEKDKLRAAKEAKDAAEAARIAAERAALLTEGDIEGTSSTAPKAMPEPDEQAITENQAKYAELLGVDVSKVTNKNLYEFIDRWMGTPYLMGGETEVAIDCSSFSQRLFVDSYDRLYLERTAQKQFDSELTELFKDKQYLSEGDLIFFGKDSFSITHVGVYLHNNKFVHATANKREGPSGVKISDLSDPFWTRLYFSSGRRQRQKQ